MNIRIIIYFVLNWGCSNKVFLLFSISYLKVSFATQSRGFSPLNFYPPCHYKVRAYLIVIGVYDQRGGGTVVVLNRPLHPLLLGVEVVVQFGLDLCRTSIIVYVLIRSISGNHMTDHEFQTCNDKKYAKWKRRWWRRRGRRRGVR